MQPLLHLVIVDDEAFMRENLASIFPWQELGYQVDALCSNGQEAMEYLKAFPVDVVLTDIQMPVMDGLSLARICMERKSSAVIVLLSASYVSTIFHRHLNQTFSEYLTAAPFNSHCNSSSGPDTDKKNSLENETEINLSLLQENVNLLLNDSNKIMNMLAVPAYSNSNSIYQMLH